MGMGDENPNKHKHSFELKEYQKHYTCNGCKEIGYGERYRCEECNFELHEACMFPQTTPFSHEFFPKNCTFEFMRTPPQLNCHVGCKRRCDACRKNINGFVYHSKKHNLDLHPCCRNLDTKYQIKGEGEEEVMELKLHAKVRRKCLWCKRRSVNEGDHSNGWSYISDCGKILIHVSCVTQIFFEDWKQWTDENCTTKLNPLPLQTVNLREIQAHGRARARGNKYWRILKVFIHTIAGILIGDPTITLTSLLLDFLA